MTKKKKKPQYRYKKTKVPGIAKVTRKADGAVIGFQIDYIDPDGKRVRRTFKKFGDAKKEREARMVAMEEGTYRSQRPENRTTLVDLARDYETHCREAGQDWDSFKAYAIPIMLDFMGPRTTLGTIDLSRARAFKSHLRNNPTEKRKLANGCVVGGKKRSGATLNRYMNMLTGMFRFALEEGKVQEYPFGRGKLTDTKAENDKTRYLSREEQAALLAQCRGDLYDIVVVTLETGMRRTEVLSVVWKEVDFKEGFIRLDGKRTKSKRSRSIPLSPAARALLLEIRERQGLTSPYVFPNPKTGKPRKDVKTAFKTAMDRAGIPDASFHTLRHTFATWFYRETKDVATLQKIMGHASITTTMRYTHIDEEQMQLRMSQRTSVTDLPAPMPDSCQITHLESKKAKVA